MRSYKELFRTPEFTPLFLSTAASTMALSIRSLVLGTLIYQTTGSPLLSTLIMFCPQLMQVVGAMFLLSASDGLPPRLTLTSTSLAFAACTAVLALPNLTVGGSFAIVLFQGLIAAGRAGTPGGLLNEILPKGAYTLGRSVFTMTSALIQIIGFAVGGALLAALPPRVCLLPVVGLYAMAALSIRFGTRARPPRSADRPSVQATWRTNMLLLSSRPRRLTYLGLWVPNGLIIGCESLFPSFAPRAAGTLFACSALGMLVSNLVIGRFLSPALRSRLAAPLLLLLATPYLFFALKPGILLAALAAFVAAIGFGASLVQQERLMSLTSAVLPGHILGLYSSGGFAAQGASAALAGALAELTSPAMAMTAMAAVSVSATVALAAAGRWQKHVQIADDGGLASAGALDSQTRIARCETPAGAD